MLGPRNKERETGVISNRRMQERLLSVTGILRELGKECRLASELEAEASILAAQRSLHLAIRKLSTGGAVYCGEGDDIPEADGGPPCAGP